MQPRAPREPPTLDERALPLADARLVVIATSAGGLNAVGRVLAALPVDFPAAIAVVQHRGLQHPELLLELLGKWTALPVRHARSGEPLEAGVVYVCPPGMHMTAEHCVRLSGTPRINFVRPSADLMLRSAARTYGDRSVGVVLSGTGRDGAIGCLAIAQAGGTVIVQEASSCEFPGMPQAAAHLAAPGLVLPPEQIGEVLLQLVTGRPVPRRRDPHPAPARTRVLLVDDHPILRDGLRRLLEAEPDMEVIGEAEDGRAAVRLTIELTPDVVVMDISMPLLDGFEATRQIMEYDPTTRVVVLSADADPQAKVEILGAGASAYLTKQSAYGELARAIRLAMTEPSDPSGPSGPTGPTGPAGRDAI